MAKEVPRRKPLRMQGYDYDRTGAYFLTICTENRKRILSHIVGGGALDAPCVRLTRIGEIVEKYIISTDKIPNVTVDRYVIMPNHIHLIVFVRALREEDRGESCVQGTSRAPSPTNKVIPHIVSTFKRFCNAEIGENIFQRYYIDHIIRDREDYEAHVKYIYENPMRWHYDELYSDE